MPVDDQDGGQPGGNIRVAYLYKPDLIRLYKPNPGGALDANEVLAGPTLKYNPGRIDPSNTTWTASRKPLVAQWEVIGKAGAKKRDVFFTVNVHFASKGGSSSLHGDARPPVNGGVGELLKLKQLVRHDLTHFLQRIVSNRRVSPQILSRYVWMFAAARGGKAARRRVAAARFSCLGLLVVPRTPPSHERNTLAYPWTFRSEVETISRLTMKHRLSFQRTRTPAS